MCTLCIHGVAAGTQPCVHTKCTDFVSQIWPEFPACNEYPCVMAEQLFIFIFVYFMSHMIKILSIATSKANQRCILKLQPEIEERKKRKKRYVSK